MTDHDPTLMQACDKHAHDGPRDARDFSFCCCWPEDRGLSSSYTPNTPNATIWPGNLFWSAFSLVFLFVLRRHLERIQSKVCFNFNDSCMYGIYLRSVPQMTYNCRPRKSVRQKCKPTCVSRSLHPYKQIDFQYGPTSTRFRAKRPQFIIRTTALIKFPQTDQKWTLICSAWVGIKQSSKPFLGLSNSVHYVSHKTIENEFYVSFYCLALVILSTFTSMPSTRSHFITAIAQATAPAYYSRTSII